MQSKDRTVTDLFEEQVASTPDAVALEFGDEQLSYDELNIRANRLAHYLQARGVGPEVMVAICVERSIEMVVGLLGILKAGGAYVPLAPDYPQTRLEFMLEDTGAPLLLTQSSLRTNLPAFTGKVVQLDTDWPAIERESSDNPVSATSSASLMYIIYTSGSTGRPKGVCVEHHSAVRLVKNTNYVALGPDEVFLQFAPISFDASTFELWGSLLNGAKLVIFPAEWSSLKELGQVVEDKGITTLWLTSALFSQMVDQQLHSLAGVRQLLAGGETLSVPHVQKMLEQLGNHRLINGYGPTENTTFTCCHVMTADSRIEGSVPIGLPISNTTVYILDAQMNPVPVGVFGELYTGGDGVARGYLNRPELTAEKFIDDPFSDEPGGRLYNTGDVVRYREDGTIEFMGRRDQQVKIRGFRIELGEVEAALAQAPGVREAIVVCREDEPKGERQLVGYVAPETVSPGELRSFMRQNLPDYMVPSVFVALAKFPLNVNGKVDRQALPVPDLSRQTDVAYIAPRNAVEKELATIWGGVLGLDSPGVEDGFFDLGGHSLSATQIISRIFEAFQVQLDFAGFFENPTLAQQARMIELAGTDPAGKDLCLIPPAPHDVPLPLSFSQERVWFIQQLNPDSMAYYFQAVLKFHGALKLDVLQQTLNEIVRRHEMFRTTFHEMDGRPLQRIHPPCPAAFELVDLQAMPASEREAEAVRLVEVAIRQPCDLTALPLVRWILIQLGDGNFHMAHIEHHLIHDGWSFNVFLDEFLTLYRAYAAGEVSPLPELAIQFGDFAYWQRGWMEGAAAAAQLAYWKQQLAGSLPVTELPYDRPRPAVQSFQGGACRVRLPLDLLGDLRALGQREGITLFTILMSGMMALLHRYSGRDEVCVGTGIANRRWRETERLIGMVINNLVLRAGMSGALTVEELLKQVHQVTLDAYANQDMPFDKVVEAIAPKRDLSMNPLFQVLFAMHGSPMTDLTLPGVDLDMQIGLNNGSAKFDLTINVLPDSAQNLGMRPGSPDDGLTFVWDYSADLFDVATVERMAGHYEQLLRGMANEPRSLVDELPLMAEDERYQLLVEFNRTRIDYPADCSVHQLFEAQAARTPDAVALVFGDQHLTYEELNSRANQLAHHLRSLGVGPDVLVGICLERSPEMVICLLGVLKAGGAYVPLDPAYPPTRLALMLEDAEAPVLLSQAHAAASLPDNTAHVICVDTDREIIAAESKENPVGEVDGENLAHVIFTSGSTGTPKGVMVPHRALSNFLCAMRESPGLDADDRLLAVASLSFDISALELYLPLITGAQIVLADRNTASDPTLLKHAIAANGITVMQATPASWRMLRDAGWEGEPRLKALTGGEVLPRELAQWLRPRCGVLWNLYGPTETTIYSTAHEVKAGEDLISIGRPIANTQVYILDKALQPVPFGVPGELYIGGAGLARGYLNKPDMTAEKFIANPFSDKPADLLYRTGDLARLLPDGRLECLGRIDHQIKLRGFRIELGEVESVLAKHPLLHEVIVLAREDSPGEKRLVAYVIPAGEPVAENELAPQLRAFAQEQLPDYMVPSAFVLLDEWPLTPNGKVDRKLLPEPHTNRQVQADFVEPETATQQTIAEIWSELLHVDQVSLNDSFFELGGHSLLATQVASRLRARFNLELALSAIFENTTVAELAEHLESLQWLSQKRDSTTPAAQDLEGGAI